MSLLTTASLVVTPNAGEEGTLFSVVPNTSLGDLSVTRATTATRVNSAGLVELVPYNLLQYSEDFSNASWNKIDIQTVTTGITDPNGGTTGVRIIPFVGFNGIMTQSFSTSVGSTYTLTFWMKGNANGVLNVNYGGAVLSPQNNVSYTTQWQQFQYSFTADSTTGSILFGGFFTWASGQQLDFTFAQLVEGSVAKDYQKTETRLNIPRLDYSNGTCPSILVEPQRTNLVTYSSSFDNGVWLLGNNVGAATVTANNAIAPDGTLTADKIAFPAVGSPSQWSLLFRPFTASAMTYSGSFYIKGELGTEVVWISFTKDGVNYTQQICNLTTEWQRFTLSPTLTAGADNFQLGVDTRDSSQTARPAQTIYIWGAQLELGSYATSYIPTTSASVTRNADVISKTGISSLIGQTEGTLFMDVVTNGLPAVDQYYMNISDGSTNNIVYLGFYATILVARILNGGSLVVNINVGLAENTRYKIAFAYKNNDCVVYVNGVLQGSDNTATIPATSKLSYNDFNETSNFDLNASALWKTRLTNAQLASLTSL